MNSGIDYKQLEEIVSLINKCTDAYVFIYDLTADTYSISEAALKLFDLPSAQFSNATESILKVVYSEDRKLLTDDIKSIVEGKKNTHNLEYRWVNRNGLPMWISCRGETTSGGVNGHILLVGRIALIEKTSDFDSLTGLAANKCLHRDFERCVKAGKRISGFLFKIDIDNLSEINERCGRVGGDKVISLVADCCRKSADKTTMLYRFGSDEMICMNLTGENAEDAKLLYRSLKRSIAEFEQRLGYEVIFTVSAGAVAFFGEVPQLEDLMKKLDFSLSQAKRKGKNTLVMFNAVDYTQHLRKVTLQEKLRLSIKNNFEGFELYYQPIIDAKSVYKNKDSDETFDIIGAEALIRWNSPDMGMLNPDDFIPILEESGLIIPVGRWVLTTAFTQCHKWNMSKKDFCISVNLSYIQIKRNDILTDVQLALDTSGVNPLNVVLELTESGSIDSSNSIYNLLDGFAKMKINLDIDDFGTGYSNLRYLQEIHARTLKLDYTFVHKATTGGGSEMKVIKYISDMSHALGMTVCMEGIETKEDINKLEGCNPDKFQGYYFGRPSNVIQFEEQHLFKTHM